MSKKNQYVVRVWAGESFVNFLSDSFARAVRDARTAFANVHVTRTKVLCRGSVRGEWVRGERGRPVALIDPFDVIYTPTCTRLCFLFTPTHTSST